jgi:hypothetical protein
LSCIVSSRYLARAIEMTDGFMYVVVVMCYSVCR